MEILMNKKYLSFTLATLLLTACGGGNSASSKNDGKGSIDFAQYFPKESMSKSYIVRNQYEGTPKITINTETIEVLDQIITTTLNGEVIEKVVITDKNITINNLEEGTKNQMNSIYRHVDIGDTLFSKKRNSSKNNSLGKITTDTIYSCNVASKEKKFQKEDYLYEGDLLKLECVAKGKVTYEIKQDILDEGVASDLNGTHDIYDKSYVYLQKGLGEVVSVNEDCITNDKIPLIINDNAKPSQCVQTRSFQEFYVNP